MTNYNTNKDLTVEKRAKDWAIATGYKPDTSQYIAAMEGYVTGYAFSTADVLERVAEKCRFLSTRNGNQPQFDAGWNEAMKHLIKILEAEVSNAK